MYNKRLGVRDMTSEWRDHVATRAREIAADKETEPYRYDVRDEPVIPMEEVDKAFEVLQAKRVKAQAEQWVVWAQEYKATNDE